MTVSATVHVTSRDEAVPMQADQAYRVGVRAILVSARDLQEALEAEDVADVPALANNLLESALARETDGVVASFRAESGKAAEKPTPVTMEMEFSLALIELEIGEVLLAGSTAVSAANPEDVLPTLAEAADHLDDANSLIAVPGEPAVLPFHDTDELDPGDFFRRLPTTVDGIVTRTAALGQTALEGLAVIPGVQIRRIATSVLSVVPEVGALTKAGMRAITRALRALIGLIPDGLGERVREWAGQWWDEQRGSVVENVARSMLSVPKVEAEIAESLRAIQQREGPPNAVLLQGLRELEQLEARHARITKMIDKIMKVLSRLVGVLALTIVAAAAWIYGAGAVGLLTALGIGIWIGRDYLDAGAPLERTLGLLDVLSKVAG